MPRLLGATERFSADEGTAEDIRLLLALGSSLGGARPNASVIDRDGQLAIAKFPKNDDDNRISLWEALALSLAAKAGIPTPEWRLQSIKDKAVLILKRFDRVQVIRLPYLSSMSMLGAIDNETHSYMEIADALRQYPMLQGAGICSTDGKGTRAIGIKCAELMPIHHFRDT